MYREAEGAGFCFGSFWFTQAAWEQEAREFWSRAENGHASEMPRMEG